MPDFKTYIYGLLCPIDNKIHYVGQSFKPVARYKQHIARSSMNPTIKDGQALTPKQEWLMRLDREARTPRLVILQVIDPETLSGYFSVEVSKAERSWIAKLYEEGHPLTNFNREKCCNEQNTLEDAMELGREMFDLHLPDN